MSVRPTSLLAGALALLAAVITPAQPASATSPYLVIPPKAEAEASASYRYAHMTQAQALAELDRRKVPYRRLKRVAGVRTPVRLTGPLHGVSIHGALPEAQRETSVFEVVDARFLLALDDFARLLARHDIVEVVHFTMYRPNGPKPGSPEEKLYRERLRKQEEKARGDVGRSSAKHDAGKRPAKRAGSKRAGTKSAASKRAGSKRAGSKRAGSKRAGSKRAAAPKGRAKVRTPRKANGKPPRKGTRSKGAAPKRGQADRKQSALMVELAQRKAKGSAPGAKAAAKPGRRRAARRQGKRRPEPLRKKLWSPPGTRHPAGLAIDVGILVKRDGRRLGVAHHFRGHIGAQTCGANVVAPPAAEARELRSIVCEARDLGIFTYVLTPNYDRAHVDHFHMEIRAGVRWYLYH